MNRTEAQSRIAKLFDSTVRKDRLIRNAHLLVHSERLGIHLTLAEGSGNGTPAHQDQPYFVASVSKLFAAALCGVLVKQGIVSFDDLVSAYADPELLRGLHIYKERDYGNEIRIKHLLNHTSGLNDFFEDKPKGETSLLDLIFSDSLSQSKPREVLEWTKTRLGNRFPPGGGFHYSDTGYHLLGLTLEQATGKPYHELLRKYLFEPLDMKQTYFSRLLRSDRTERPSPSPSISPR